MDFYSPALASNTLPDDWERDEDGVWKPRPTNPVPDPGSSRTSGTTLSSLVSPSENLADFGQLDLHDETDASSISSIVAEYDNEVGRGEDRSTSPGTEKTTSGRATPHLQPLTMTETMQGVGHALLNERQVHRRPTRLEEPHDEYGRLFIAHKEKLAGGKIFPLSPHPR